MAIFNEHGWQFSMKIEEKIKKIEFFIERFESLFG